MQIKQNIRFYREIILNYAVIAFLLLSIVLVFSTRHTGDYEAFLDVLGMRESSDDYRAENRHGYLGRYQLGNQALQDAGFLDENGNWTGECDIYSKLSFLNAPDAQERAVRVYHKKLCHYISVYELDTYLGKKYEGVTVTESGLLAACHLVGARSMRDALQNNKSVRDANGVSAAEYMELLSGYDISEVMG